MVKDAFGASCDSSFCDPFLGGPAFTLPLLTDPSIAGHTIMESNVPCSETCSSSSSSAVATQPNHLAHTRAGQLPVLTCKMNVEDTADKYIVTADVPSFDKVNLKLSVTDDNMLTVSGEQTKEFLEESKDKHYLRKERSFGVVHRSLQLPKNADKSKITARSCTYTNTRMRSCCSQDLYTTMEANNVWGCDLISRTHVLYPVCSSCTSVPTAIRMECYTSTLASASKRKSRLPFPSHKHREARHNTKRKQQHT
jgi:HSP20 family molecular chaperone IbpA